MPELNNMFQEQSTSDASCSGCSVCICLPFLIIFTPRSDMATANLDVFCLLKRERMSEEEEEEQQRGGVAEQQTAAAVLL